MKQTSLDALNSHLFSALEGLKNNSDPDASANEKMDLETAKQVANIGKVVVAGYKVQADIMRTMVQENPDTAKQMLMRGGFLLESKTL